MFITRKFKGCKLRDSKFPLHERGSASARAISERARAITEERRTSL